MLISASRARIQFSLPVTVLISPLWAIRRNGWASGHDGNVFVENRECTMPSALVEPIVLQVKVERLELRRGQHALVDEGLTGKAWEVNGFAAGAVLAGALGAELVLGTLAHDVRAALQVHAGGAAR